MVLFEYVFVCFVCGLSCDVVWLLLFVCCVLCLCAFVSCFMYCVMLQSVRLLVCFVYVFGCLALFKECVGCVYGLCVCCVCLFICVIVRVM